MSARGGRPWAVAPIPDPPALAKNQCVQQVQISYHRPAGLSDGQLRSWLGDRADSPLRMTLEPGTTNRGLVRVTLEELNEPSRVEDVIAGLVGDMRMLGLQPVIVLRT
jgi:hypothetical protein